MSSLDNTITIPTDLDNKVKSSPTSGSLNFLPNPSQLNVSMEEQSFPKKKMNKTKRTNKLTLEIKNITIKSLFYHPMPHFSFPSTQKKQSLKFSSKRTTPQSMKEISSKDYLWRSKSYAMKSLNYTIVYKRHNENH